MAAGESCGVIGEPTSLDVVYAHKGGCVFKATSRGVAAHSSTRKGVNANLAMIPFLVEMKQIYEESETDPACRRDQFEPPTICWNIGINDFTTAINITPPQSVCTVCFRPMPGSGAEVLIGRAREAARRCGVEFEVIIRGEPLYVDPRSAYVQRSGGTGRAGEAPHRRVRHRRVHLHRHEEVGRARPGRYRPSTHERRMDRLGAIRATAPNYTAASSTTGAARAASGAARAASSLLVSRREFFDSVPSPPTASAGGEGRVRGELASRRESAGTAPFSARAARSQSRRLGGTPRWR